MKKVAKILIAGGVCSVFWAMPASASTNLETSSSLAGISVALNNFYASTEEPEQALASVFDAAAATSVASGGGGGGGQAAQGGQSGETAAATTAAPETTKAKSSPYDNVAVSKVNGYVNIRTEANTTSGVTGKIYNDSAATILDTVDGEGGKWYKIKSGSVTGYIKAEYFVTGAEAETKAKQVGTQYGTVVGTPTLRLRKSPDLTSQTLTLLAEGAHYVVLEEQGDFLKVAVDSDLEGYVFKDYMNTTVEFQKAVSVEEEKAKAEDEAKRKKEAEEAIRKLEEAKEAERKKTTTAAETTKKETTTAATTKSNGNTADGTIPVNPEQGRRGERGSAHHGQRNHHVQTQGDHNRRGTGRWRKFRRGDLGHAHGHCGLRQTVLRQPLCLRRHQPHKRRGLLRLCHERVRPFRDQHRKKLQRPGGQGKDDSDQRGEARRPAVLCQRGLYQPCGDLHRRRTGNPRQHAHHRNLPGSGQLPDAVQGGYIPGLRRPERFCSPAAALKK